MCGAVRWLWLKWNIEYFQLCVSAISFSVSYLASSGTLNTSCAVLQWVQHAVTMTSLHFVAPGSDRPESRSLWPVATVYRATIFYTRMGIVFFVG